MSPHPGREYHCRLPRGFVQDREGRDLPTGRHGPFKGNVAVCWPTIDVLTDMASDAIYQAEGVDCGTQSIRRSASRAYEILQPIVSAATADVEPSPSTQAAE